MEERVEEYEGERRESRGGKEREGEREERVEE